MREAEKLDFKRPNPLADKTAKKKCLSPLSDIMIEYVCLFGVIPSEVGDLGSTCCAGMIITIYLVLEKAEQLHRMK